MRLPNAIASLVLLSAAASSCGGGGSGSTGPSDSNNPYGLTTTGPGVLSVTPLDTTTI